MKKLILLFLMLVGILNMEVLAQISITTNSYSQDFNTLINTGTSDVLPSGWAISESGTNANSTYTAGTGSGTSGDTYSFGTSGSSDRALGGLLSSSLVPRFGAGFTNNTGETITSLTISYTGEQWRCGTTGRSDRIDFQYSLDATNISTGTWTDVDQLDFTSPSTTTVGALDGNVIANKTLVSYEITGLTLINGASFFIRWNDINVTGADDGLSVDDFLMTNDSPLPVQLTSFTAKTTKAGVMLNWTTATEVNNFGFDVETLNATSSKWEKVGFVEGHGNSNSPKEYSFFDNSGATSYRLKQVDFNGNYEYSDVVTVKASLAKTELYQNSPNPFNPSTKISFSLAETGKVNVSVYNVIGQKVADLVNQTMESGVHNVDFNASNLPSGLYIYRLDTPNYSKTMKMMLLK